MMAKAFSLSPIHAKLETSSCIVRGKLQMRIIFLLLAILAVGSMASIGIFIAEQNIVMMFVSILLMIVSMAVGFVLKARLRKQA